MRGNRYSVPDQLVSKTVVVRIGLDGLFSVHDGDTLATRHRLRPASEGWVTVPEHHARLWRQAVAVDRRPLTVYEEVATCS